MSRDFAKTTGKKSKNSRNNSRGKTPASPIKWLLTGLVLGIGVALLTYFQLAGDKIPKVNLTEQKTSKVKKTKEFPAVEAPTEKEYEFWEMLKYKQIEVPQNDQPTTTTDKPTRRYVMQCGSFKQKHKAEALKATIGMAGFESTIHITDEKDGFSWHRVVLGPYTSKRKAEANRHRLNESGIGGCRIW